MKEEQLNGAYQYFLNRIKDAQKDYTYIQEYVSFNNKSVLEIGCGTGGKSFFFSQLSGFVVGVDISDNIEQGPTFVHALEVESPKVYFALSDGACLPFAREVFDIVVIHDTMEHLPRPAEVIAESCRVLKRHGQISIIMPHYYGLSGSHLWNYYRRSIWRYLHVHVLVPQWLLKRVIWRIGRCEGYSMNQIQREWNQFVTLNRIRAHDVIALLESCFDLQYVHFREGRLPLGFLRRYPLVEELFSWGVVIVASKR